MRILKGFIFLAVILLAAPLIAAEPTAQQFVPKMTVDTLKSRLDKGEEIVVIDTRVRGMYQLSDIKIEGAIDIPLVEVSERIADIPFGKEIVTYCT